MNDIFELLKSRRSIKKYSDKEVPREIIDKIVTAGTFAPSGKNLQSSIILAVTNKDVRDRLSKLNASVLGVNIDPFYGAPVVLIVLAKKDVFTHIYDGSLVMANMMLEATSLGIGSCWIHRAKEMFEKDEGKKLLEELGINDEYEGIGNLIIGYSDSEGVSHSIKDDYIYYID